MQTAVAQEMLQLVGVLKRKSSFRKGCFSFVRL